MSKPSVQTRRLSANFSLWTISADIGVRLRLEHRDGGSCSLSQARLSALIDYLVAIRAALGSEQGAFIVPEPNPIKTLTPRLFLQRRCPLLVRTKGYPREPHRPQGVGEQKLEIVSTAEQVLEFEAWEIDALISGLRAYQDELAERRAETPASVYVAGGIFEQDRVLDAAQLITAEMNKHLE